MVTLQILVLSFQVRILVSQLNNNKPAGSAGLFFPYGKFMMGEYEETLLNMNSAKTDSQSILDQPVKALFQFFELFAHIYKSV